VHSRHCSLNPTSAARQQLQPVEDPVEPSTNRCILAYSPALNPDGAFAVGRVGRATIRALHLDAAILGDATAELLFRQVRRRAVQRHQRPHLIPLEPQQRLLARGAVNPHVRNLPVSPLQMALHLAPGVKAVPGNVKPFHLAHTPFILPFGLGPGRPAGLSCENPVAGKGGKGGVDHQSLPPPRQEEGALDLAADLSPFRASGVSVQSLRSSPRCIALGDRALVNWRKGTCGANGSQA